MQNLHKTILGQISHNITSELPSQIPDDSFAFNAIIATCLRRPSKFNPSLQQGNQTSHRPDINIKPFCYCNSVHARIGNNRFKYLFLHCAYYRDTYRDIYRDTYRDVAIHPCIYRDIYRDITTSLHKPVQFSLSSIGAEGIMSIS